MTNNTKSPSLEELSLMTVAERDLLTIYIFNILDSLEYKLEKMEFNYQAVRNLDENLPERRKFPRTKIPAKNSSFCELMLPTPKEDSSEEYKKKYALAIEESKRSHIHSDYCPMSINLIHFQLFDISMSGCSILNHNEVFSYFLMPHKIYENCRIVMPNSDEIIVSFEIMTQRNIECYDAHEFNEIIGLKFIHVDYRRRAKISTHENHVSSTRENHVSSTFNYEVV